ncbi:Uncharacterized protein SCF082_LOCUS47600 [Durusdinium trenchii]|uniref:Uncharacterized protein n=1 Tax=Durusdinium trenchii TaxID=1381693 RepID=A0ABP0RMH3_9DINO
MTSSDGAPERQPSGLSKGRFRLGVSEARPEEILNLTPFTQHIHCHPPAPMVGRRVGLGPAGIGKRTLQVRAEKRLRESAEERSARLVREVAALAGDTAEQQATIESLSRRLEKVRTLISQKEARLASAAQQSTQLQARLKGTGCAQDKMFKGRKHVSSTGKLPQLSY